VSVVYDTGLLIAAERNDRHVWADHRARLELGIVPRTTAPVIAQVSRSPRQAQLRGSSGAVMSTALTSGSQMKSAACSRARARLTWWTVTWPSLPPRAGQLSSRQI
jgi:hypothetical protein